MLSEMMSKQPCNNLFAPLVQWIHASTQHWVVTVENIVCSLAMVVFSLAASGSRC